MGNRALGRGEGFIAVCRRVGNASGLRVEGFGAAGWWGRLQGCGRGLKVASAEPRCRFQAWGGQGRRQRNPQASLCRWGGGKLSHAGSATHEQQSQRSGVSSPHGFCYSRGAETVPGAGRLASFFHSEATCFWEQLLPKKIGSTVEKFRATALHFATTQAISPWGWIHSRESCPACPFSQVQGSP